MSGIKIDLMWSPHEYNKFITIGPDIQLYEIDEVKKGGVQKPAALTIGNEIYANLLATNAEHPYLKCVSWYPKPQHNQLLAIGLANGKVVLNSFKGNIEDIDEFTGKEFKPMHSRPCNCISWNPNDSKLLACGLEKNRYDHGLLVWDVTRPIPTATETIGYDKRHHPVVSFPMDSHSFAKPAVELGLSEATQSLHWFNHNAQLIVCGVNNKHIKIYDLRDPSKHQNSTPTKAVYDVIIDPYFEHRLASVYENLFVLWDIRNFEKPVVTSHEQKPIQKICWCPTRWGLLAALIKDHHSIKLYDIQSSVGNDEVEPTIVERCIRPFQNGTMSFAWHPTKENRMITISLNSVLLDYTVFDRITLNWAATSQIIWTHGKKVLLSIDERDKVYSCLDDLGVKMKKRACKGYGLTMHPVWMNGALSEDSGLLGVWVWLDFISDHVPVYFLELSTQEKNHQKLICAKTHRQDKKSRSKGSFKYKGVHTIVCGENGINTTSTSEVRQMSWVGLNCTTNPVLKYFSAERERALQLCGWGSNADVNVLPEFLERLESEKKHMRAASISVFCLDIRRAIQILHRGALPKKNTGKSHSHTYSIDLNAVAMALAGFTDDKSALWREISSDLKSKLADPHLRAMFAFLTTDGDNFDEILNETGIAVQDKLAIALLYLPDKKLAEYLERLKNQMLHIGSLDGILLTGLTNDGLALIQRYVDITGDVQTASLIILHTLPSQMSQDYRAQAWVQSYRNLLDVWKLWKNRAIFDVQWYKSYPNENKPAQQVFVSCTFCGKSVSNYLQPSGLPPNNTRFSQIASAQKNKVTCCPGCRKPLPRCALCLSHMGTPAGIHWKRPVEGKPEKKLSEFSNWLSWCETCRHGGHSVHILGWFEQHTECPVTGCNCKCMALDPVSKLSPIGKSS